MEDHNDISYIVFHNKYGESGIAYQCQLEWEHEDREYALISSELMQMDVVSQACEVFELSIVDSSQTEGLILVKRGNDVLRQTLNVSR
jgi:hypothetical protein